MTNQQVARGLGWFSIGLGASEIFASRWLGEKTGIGPRVKTLRTFGAREIGAGIGLLVKKDPGPALWSRFAGDLMDFAFVAGSFKRSLYRKRLAITLFAVSGAALLDYYYARRFT